ncbi:hypothetical protein ACH4VT_33680 [Streptomyces lydicus]|uniref:hypothetical protein n=1 Tax=Streptomyces lydicus TaxID=47763 RepID=UPI0037A4EDD3
MLTGLDPEQVPATPIYSVILNASGPATINGEPVTALPGHDPRMAVIAELRRRAALRGRPIRASAKEINGVHRPLIVTPDGDVMELKASHPQPVTAAPPPPQAAPEARNQPVSTTAASAPAEPDPDAARRAWCEYALVQIERHEQQARTQYGTGSLLARNWSRLRTELEAGGSPWEAATELWIAALHRALAGQAPDVRQLREMAQSAVQSWIGADPEVSVRLAPRLHAVLRRIDNGVDLIAAVEQRMDDLHTMSAPKGER